MPFQYEGYRSPFANSIAEIMLRRGDIAARQAETIGNAQARAAEASGNAWAGATQSIGQAIAGIPSQIQQAKRQGLQDQLLQGRVTDDARLREGEGAVDAMLRGDQLPDGAQGPRQQNYLDTNGLFDIGKMTTALGQSGMGHLAPELLKGAESINESITKHQQLEQQMGVQSTILRGDMADGVLKLAKAGMPIVQAMDLVVQPALATKRMQPQEYQQIRAQIAELPPDQQQAALGSFMDAAAKLGGGKTLGKDAQELDRYGRVVASNVQPDKPTEATLDADAQALYAKRASGVALTPAETATLTGYETRKGAKRTDAEQALDAYAKSIGKAKAEDLTYAERQKFEQGKAKIASDQAFTQHQRERQYDISNPIPEKAANQDKLEQQYRAVLARGLSSRSGGLGLEDAKVQQANHLIALLDQTYDAKSDAYNIPKTLQGELAAGLARLVAPGGSVGIEMMREFDQRTAKGDLAGALSYVTGHPFPTATNDFAKLLKDSIERQGKVAEQNREGEMRYLRGLAPTELEEERRTKLEANSLNQLRQSRLIQNTKTGERKQQVSIDGGKSWQ